MDLVFGFFPVKMVDLDRPSSGVELRNMVICLPMESEPKRLTGNHQKSRRVRHCSTMMKFESELNWDWMIGSSKIVDLTQQTCYIKCSELNEIWSSPVKKKREAPRKMELQSVEPGDITHITVVQ
jgi:hypothetical protein